MKGENKQCETEVIIPHGIIGYTDGKTCAVCGNIHTSPPHTEESWREEFDEIMNYELKSRPVDIAGLGERGANQMLTGKVKSFISQKLTEAREEREQLPASLVKDCKCECHKEYTYKSHGLCCIKHHAYKEGKATAIEEVVKRLRDARGIATGGKKHNRSWNEGANAVLREAIKASTALKDITRDEK